MPNNKPRIAILVSEFHSDLADEMLAAAEKMLNDSKAMASQTIHVAGVYEMPLMVDQLLVQSTIDGVVRAGLY